MIRAIILTIIITCVLMYFFFQRMKMRRRETENINTVRDFKEAYAKANERYSPKARHVESSGKDYIFYDKHARTNARKGSIDLVTPQDYRYKDDLPDPTKNPEIFL